MKKFFVAITLLSFTVAGSAIAVLEQPALVNSNAFFPYLVGQESGVDIKAKQYGLFDHVHSRNIFSDSVYQILIHAGKIVQDLSQPTKPQLFSKSPTVLERKNSYSYYELGRLHRPFYGQPLPVQIINPFLDKRSYVVIQPYFDGSLRGLYRSQTKHSTQNSQSIILTAPNDAYYANQWALAAIGAESAWDFTKGLGVTIAIIDTGIDYTHPDISSNIWINPGEIPGNGIDDDHDGLVDDYMGWDFSNNDNNPMDDNGHGTHVAGISSATQNNSAGISGIAPESKVMALKVLNNYGGGSAQQVLDAIVKALYFAIDHGARVVNLSLGLPLNFFTVDSFETFSNAFEKAKEAGVIVVAAAGNSDSLINVYPGLSDNVITVGAIDTSRTKASFSSFGPGLDVMAPGVSILSLRSVNINTSSIFAPPYPDANGKYMFLDGTSMASPMVSGLVALMLARDPLLTFDDIYRRLEYSSTDLGASGFDNYYGYGLINPFNALSYDYYNSYLIKTHWLAQPDTSGVIEYGYSTTGVIIRRVYAAGGIFEYYDDGITLKKKTTASGDVFEYYLSGNLEKETTASGVSHGYYESGALQSFFDPYTHFTYVYYDDGLTINKIIYPDQHMEEFTFDHKLFSFTVPTGAVTFFYSSGNRQSLYDPSLAFTIEYEDASIWIDGYGHSYGRKLRSFDSGTQTFYTDYWSLTNAVKAGQTFDLFTGDLVGISTYYEDGNMKTCNDIYTGINYIYYDQNFDGYGKGLISDSLYADGTEYRDISYWDNTSTIKAYHLYKNDVYMGDYEYYSNGALKTSYTVETGLKDIYFNTTFGGGGTQRLSIEIYPNRDQLNVFGWYSGGAPSATADEGAQESSSAFYSIKSFQYYENGNISIFTDGKTKDVFNFYDTGKLKQIDLNDYQSNYYNTQGVLTKTIVSDKDIIEYSDASVLTRHYYKMFGKDVTFYGDGISKKDVLIATGLTYHYDQSGGFINATTTTPGAHYYAVYPSGNVMYMMNNVTGYYIYFNDENYYGIDPTTPGHAVGRQQRYTSATQEYKIMEYWPSTDIPKTVQHTRVGQALTETFTFYQDGTIQSITNLGQIYETANYYASGRYEGYGSKTDPSGSWVLYADENFYDSTYPFINHGRILQSRFYPENGRHSDVSTFEYWLGTDKVKKETRSDISDVVLKVIDYYSNGISAQRVTFPDGSIHEYYLSGNRQYFLDNSTQTEEYYLNENYYGDTADLFGQGRISKRIYPDGNEFRYLNYWKDTDRVQSEQKYQSGVLIKKLEYYFSGNESKSTIQASGLIDEFLDENFYGADSEGHGQGRKSREVNADGSEYHYIQYWTGTDTVQIRDAYQSGTRLATYEYASNGSTITKETHYRADGSSVSYVIQNGVKTFYAYTGESIQNAINNASAGDTIYLAAGMYNERIILKNGVNLKGQDNKTTVLNGGYAAQSNVILTLGNNIIENLTITGGGPYRGFPASAIRIEGSNVTIRNNIIQNNQDYGIHVWWDAGAVTIERNLFINNQVGIQLPQNQTLIQYNTLVNNAIGINILEGKTATVKNNIITGSTFQSIYEFAWGEVPTDGYAQVSNNTFFNNAERGGYYSKCIPPAEQNQTNGNNIADPLFTDPANGNYTAPPGSPAYGRGAYAPIVPGTAQQLGTTSTVLSAEMTSYFDTQNKLTQQNATPYQAPFQPTMTDRESKFIKS